MDLDNATFEEVVNAHYEPLYRFAFSLAAHEAEARDLTQETFAQLARKAHQIHDRSKIKSWLFTTLYRAFVDSHRQKTRHPHVEVDASEGELPVTLPKAGERLDAAISLDSLRVPPGNKLEALRGDRAGQHSIRINEQWRLCFRWKDEHAYEVEIVDYH